ncbi:MAG: hypothetical protein ACRYG7_09315 [Janthinobacterium lividum]
MPGYLVRTQGDTVRGLLRVPRYVTDEGLRFRPKADAPLQKITARELRAFGLQDGRRFVKRMLPVRRNAETGVVDSAAVLLQQLVAGYASFYRYDVDVARHRSEAEYTQSETVQYFIEAGSKNLVQVRRAAQQVTLAVVFQDCPAVVAAVRHTLFDEYKLSNLVLRYDRECHANAPVYDYRLPEPVSTVQVLVSARVGMQRSTLFYPSSYYLPKLESQSATQPIFGLELRLAYAGPWSLIVGVNYARLRSTATLVQPAQLGTINAGQFLNLPISVEAQSLQAPVLVRYTVGHGLLRPYVAAGPMFGMYITNQTTLSNTTLTYVGGNTTYYRTDVTTTPVQNPRSTSPTVSGVVRLGLQFKTKTRFSPLLEAQYSAGSDSENNPGVLNTYGGEVENLGRLHYQAVSLLAGLEF